MKKSNGKLYWYGAGSDVLTETDLAGNNPGEYIFFTGKRIARRTNTGAIYYFFSDHLGSSRVVTNSTGGIVEDSDFYPFGGERVVTDSLDNNYKFTGQERDSESVLDYMKARQFSSALGRFPQPDSIAFSNVGNPQSLNLYAYVYNNPLRFVDPTGHAIDQRPLGMTEAPTSAGGGVFESSFGSLASWFSMVNSQNNSTPTTPTYDNIDPTAKQVLVNTYGADEARVVYESWTPAERATFLNIAAAAVHAGFDLSAASVSYFVRKGDQPYGVWLIGIDSSEANMELFKTPGEVSYRSPSDIKRGGLEASSLGSVIRFDVDLWNPNSIAAPLHGIEVFWNWLTRGATNPWDAAEALKSRQVCSGVIQPCP